MKACAKYFDIPTMEEEIWRPVRGYEKFYEVSNYGLVRSLDRVIPWKDTVRRIPGRVLKPHRRRDEYEDVNLSNEGVWNLHLIHTLVAQAFLENPTGLPEVDHIDRCRYNNRLDNLAWVSKSANMLNTGVRKDSALGEKNVFMERKAFVVSSVRINAGKKHYFKTLDEAKEFRRTLLGF